MPTGVSGSSSLTWPDYAVLSLVLACLIAIGVRFTREQRDTVDFFLARPPGGLPSRLDSHRLADGAHDRALQRRVHLLHRRRRREGGGLDQRLPGADLPR